MMNLHDKLLELSSNYKHWHCELPFTIDDKADSSESNEIDLCDTLIGDKPYVFPDRFSGSESKLQLLIELKPSAMKSGYNLVLRLSKSQKQLDNKHLAYLSLRCQHGVKYRAEKNKCKRVCKTIRSTKDIEPCPFRLNIALLKDSNKWTIMNCKGIKKKDAKAHTGHYRIDPSLLRTSLKMLSAEELEIAKNCAQI